MISSMRRVIVPGIAVAALAASLTACGDDEKSGGSITGGGSSAQSAAQTAWQKGYQQAHSGTTVNYESVGSGSGRESFIAGKYSFAGSDSPLSADADGGTPSEIDQAKQTCGTDAIEVPAYVSPIAIVYNLEGVDDLQLSPATAAAIFSGKLTTWDDPTIEADNPGVDLPSTTITPVHRADDSGTTANFTDWLADTAAEAWKFPADDTWPIDGGASGDQTSGMVTAVQQGDGAIGYADFSQSGGLGVASIKVGAAYVAPSAEAAAKALEVSPLITGRPDVDMAVDVDRTTTEDGAYPLMLVSYLIACQKYDDGKTADLVKGYLSYAISSDGQDAAAGVAGSAPLPDSLATQAAAIVDKIAG